MRLKENKTKQVAVVGTGFVGSSYAYSLVNQGIVSELILIDVNKERAEGEAQDLNHGVPFGSPMKIKAGSYSDCKDVDLIVITAGANQKPGETRLDLASKNANIMRGITKEIMASGFDGIIVIASNPVDIMTQVAWEATGLPKERVIGSGTILDTARFRYLLSEYFQVDSRNVHAYIIGEHGDSELPIWSHVTIGGLPLNVYGKLNNFYEDHAMQEIFENVRDAAYQIIEKKGATYYGIGMGLARLTKAILNNENSILTISTHFQGEYGIDGVFMGIPAVINASGVREILRLNLSESEQQLLEKSADILKAMHDHIAN